LRHGAFKSVDEQQATVGHVEYALYLATKVGVTRGVDDIDFIVFVLDRNVLRKNSDTSLSFKVVVIEYQLAGILILAKEISGQQHLIDQRSLTVVDVSNNGNVSDFLHILLIFKRLICGL
jgi:hypothetical protein